MLGRPVNFDFNGPPPDPDYLVDGMIERNTITVLSADSGVGKSLVCKSIIVAGIQGKPWCGRQTKFQRAMVLDEENFIRVVHGRFHALGMTNADRGKLRYFLRIGTALGAEDWVERVEDEMEDFQPDLLVIDTAAAATAVDVNDNTSVARLYQTALRPLADRAGVILLHHERKPAEGNSKKRNAGHSMMGARQWAGQADNHIAFERLSDKPQVEVVGGETRKRYVLKMEMPKNRDGASADDKIAILSKHEPGRTQAHWMRVEKVSRDG